MTSKHEKEWYRKFQEGTFLIRGWQARKKDILAAVPTTKKKEVDSLLESLGKKIGKEWAKEKHVRRIDTSMLQHWGEGLKKSKKKGTEVLLADIEKLDAEVDDMLA